MDEDRPFNTRHDDELHGCGRRRGTRQQRSGLEAQFGPVQLDLELGEEGPHGLRRDPRGEHGGFL